MLDSAQLVYLLSINTLGLSALTETFKAAAFFVSNSYRTVDDSRFNRHYMAHLKMDLREGEECLAFINGTGLDVMLESYYLAYNPERLRTQFFYTMKKIGTNGHSH